MIAAFKIVPAQKNKFSFPYRMTAIAVILTFITVAWGVMVIDMRHQVRKIRHEMRIVKDRTCEMNEFYSELNRKR